VVEELAVPAKQALPGMRLERQPEVSRLRLCRLSRIGRIPGVLAFVLLAGCFGPEHPDYSRYEYLFKDGNFVAPYTDFPEGRDRQDWKCYDGKTARTYDCTFVRGGWDRFQYVYRPRVR